MKIVKHPNGRWRARYRDNAGKEHMRHFARKADARRWLDEETAKLVTGTWVSPQAGKVTFREFAEQWRQVAPHGPATRDSVERILRLHAYPVLGDRPLNAIRHSTINAWVSGLTLAPSSAKVALQKVHAVFRAAVKDRLIPSNPAEDVKVKVRKKEVYIPELAAVLALRSALPPRYRAVVDLAIGSGLRQGELFGLEVSAVEFIKAKQVSVHQQLISQSPEPLHLAQEKTEESRRVVPLAQMTLDALAAHLAAFPPTEIEIEDRTDRYKPVTRTARLIFTTAKGTPISRSMWSQIWRPAARKAGIPQGVGIHSLRHWYASALIAGGESIKVVQKRMGHVTAAFTLDTYGHLMPDSDDRTRDAVTAALSAAGNLRAESG